MWAIKHLKPCFFGIPVVIVSYHQALEILAKIGEHHPPVRVLMGFLTANQVDLEYRKGSGHTNNASPHHLPVQATQSDTDGDSRLTHPDDVNVYHVGAS